jgi:predicted dehydrogenase
VATAEEPYRGGVSIAGTFGVVGSGYRAQLLVSVAKRVPERLALVGAAVRRAGAVEEVSQRWGVPVYLSPEELFRRAKPDFVLTSVPRTVNPSIIASLVELGAHVLSETPPAQDLPAMRTLWGQVGTRQLVQVAEQYHLYPAHVARYELVRRGLLGRPSSVQVSSTHGYHAVSLMRRALGAGFGPVSVSASVFTAPLVDPLNRSGWTDDETEKQARTTLAAIDFGEGASGLYDFTDNQWHNQLRHRRIVIRGSRGEISDDSVVRLAGPRTVLRSPIVRSQLGYDLNLDGYDTEHISFEGEVLWRNDFLGARLMDDELADAAMMVATAAWAKGEGPPPYPLAEGCQDHLVALAIEEAASTSRTVVTGVEAWAL